MREIERASACLESSASRPLTRTPTPPGRESDRQVSTPSATRRVPPVLRSHVGPGRVATAPASQRHFSANPHGGPGCEARQMAWKVCRCSQCRSSTD
jgi:hypothetical protein